MSGKPGVGVELLHEVSALAERADKDGAACRVFFAGRTARAGVIPAEDLIVLVIRPGGKRREYSRFGKEWPIEFKVAGKVKKSPRFLCSALAGVLDGILYVGTDEVRWTPVKPGERRRPVPAETEGCSCGCTRHDLHERDLRRASALNPVRTARHKLLLMLGRSSYDNKVVDQETLEAQEQLEPPNFLASINPQFQKFRLRLDSADAVAKATQVMKILIAGHGVVDESGASLLLQVLMRANRGVWLDEKYSGEVAPFSGMYRLSESGVIFGYPEAPVGHDGETEDVEGTKCLPKPSEFPDISDEVNADLDKLFEGNHHVRFEPTVQKEWAMVRQGQALWLPRDTPRKNWTPSELAGHPKYKDLCKLAALATVEMRGRLAYADFDLVKGANAWVDLDSVPRVQLVADARGLCHYGNGTHLNLSRLDIEAHIRATRASRRNP